MSGEEIMAALGNAQITQIENSNKNTSQYEGIVKPDKIVGILFPRTSP
jgi:hypothetical protein